jgi:hypothetical protein
MLSSDIAILSESVDQIGRSSAKIDENFARPKERYEQYSIKSTVDEKPELVKKIQAQQQSYHILKSFFPWNLGQLTRNMIKLNFSSICNVSLRLGDSVPTGGRAIVQANIEFPTTSRDDNDFVAGIPLAAMPQARQFIQFLLRTRSIQNLWASVRDTRHLPSILSQFSAHLQRSSTVIRELYRLRMHYHLPYLVDVIQNNDDVQLGESGDSSLEQFPLLAKLTFLRNSDLSHYFEITFGISSNYPFESIKFSLRGLRNGDPLRSHVEDIVVSASHGQSGTGCSPITSVCDALVQFLGNRG